MRWLKWLKPKKDSALGVMLEWFRIAWVLYIIAILAFINFVLLAIHFEWFN